MSWEIKSQRNETIFKEKYYKRWIFHVKIKKNIIWSLWLREALKAGNTL